MQHLLGLNLPPSIARAEQLGPATIRYTRHEVAALRAGGPSGRTYLLRLSHRPRSASHHIADRLPRRTANRSPRLCSRIEDRH
jgi:hypothetical protein